MFTVVRQTSLNLLQNVTSDILPMMLTKTLVSKFLYIGVQTKCIFTQKKCNRFCNIFSQHNYSGSSV